jgi:hypothetical protein
VIPSVPVSVRLPSEVTPVPPFRTGSAVPLRVMANVPEVVIVDGETERKAGTDTPTLVTVPPPPLGVHERFPDPSFVREPEACADGQMNA